MLFRSSLIGQIFHVPDGLQRQVRNDIFRGRPAERYYDALEWVFSAPDYVREFKAQRGPRRLARAAAARRRPPSRQRD